jgi:hypothetical protein
LTRVLLTRSFPPGNIDHVEGGERTYTAFLGDRRVAHGDLRRVLAGVKRRPGRARPVLFFEDWTGRQVDFDLRGTVDAAIARAEAAAAPPADAPASRGRPRLGVVSREVTLLPRHWEWLEQQPNGISAALRRLVDEARRREPEKERARQAAAAASRVMTALAGDRAGYEEASRALFAGDRERLARLVASWPRDVRAYVLRLASPPARLP